MAGRFTWAAWTRICTPWIALASCSGPMRRAMAYQRPPRLAPVAISSILAATTAISMLFMQLMGSCDGNTSRQRIESCRDRRSTHLLSQSSVAMAELSWARRAMGVSSGSTRTTARRCTQGAQGRLPVCNACPQPRRRGGLHWQRRVLHRRTVRLLHRRRLNSLELQDRHTAHGGGRLSGSGRRRRSVLWERRRCSFRARYLRRGMVSCRIEINSQRGEARFPSCHV